MKVEARTWRVWYHLNLLRWYGRHDGIPIVDKALAPAEVYIGRNTVEECLDFLNREFDEILSVQDEKVSLSCGMRAVVTVSAKRSFWP